MNKPSCTAVIALAAAMALSTALHAADITWGGPTNISGDSDVSTAGSVVEAVDFKTTTKVNNVTFTAVSVSGVNFVSGDFTFTAPMPFSANNNASSATGAFSLLTTSYKDLLGTYISGFGGSFNVTMTGLTLGDEYQFQWFRDDSVGASDFNTKATAGNSVSLEGDATSMVGGLGQYAIGTFVADGTTESVAFAPGNIPGSSSAINAIQLRDVTTPVPETSTWLFGAALAAVCATARRRLVARAVR
jgi:hypothetical protein